jgi:rhodanese-related sulfurtransferase
MHDSERSVGRQMAVILLSALFAGLAYNAFSGTGLPLIREAPPKVAVADEDIFGPGATPAKTPEPAPASVKGDSEAREPFRVITLAQMKKIVDGNIGVIADARTPDEFAAGHIRRSVNLYAMEPENYVDRIADLPRDTLVAVYCSNPHCNFARTVAELLETFGFTNVLLYDDGYDGWTDAGLPVVPGGDGR